MGKVMQLDKDRPLDKHNTMGLITICLSCEGLTSGRAIHGFKVEWSFDQGWVAVPGSFPIGNSYCDCDDPMPYIAVLTYDGDHHWAGNEEYDAFNVLMGEIK